MTRLSQGDQKKWVLGHSNEEKYKNKSIYLTKSFSWVLSSTVSRIFPNVAFAACQEDVKSSYVNSRFISCFFNNGCKYVVNASNFQSSDFELVVAVLDVDDMIDYNKESTRKLDTKKETKRHNWFWKGTDRKRATQQERKRRRETKQVRESEEITEEIT